MTLGPARNRRQSIDTTNSRLESLVGWVDKILPFRGLRPLDRIPSLKLKLTIVIGAAIAITIATLTVGYWLHLHPLWGIAIAILVALLLVQILARGITAPLREMMRAADDVAGGDYGRRVIATSADEVGELARSFNAMSADIADFERQQRELIANVSHELRTPIAALRGNVENLIDNVVTDENATLDAMLKQTERLGRLVSQLLDLSRLEAGATPMKIVQMDLVAVIDDALQEARLGAHRPEIVLTAPQQLLIQGDPERLHQVMTNLLDNSIRYNPNGEPIRVTVENADTGVSVVVEDRGPGVAPADLEQIFERFHRADADRAARTGGFGLGLAISKWIVDLHGGTIMASNAAQRGCVMTVRLPT